MRRRELSRFTKAREVFRRLRDTSSASIAFAAPSVAVLRVSETVFARLRMIASRRRTLTSSFAARAKRTASVNAANVASRSATRACNRKAFVSAASLESSAKRSAFFSSRKRAWSAARKSVAIVGNFASRRLCSSAATRRLRTEATKRETSSPNSSASERALSSSATDDASNFSASAARTPAVISRARRSAFSASNAPSSYREESPIRVSSVSSRTTTRRASRQSKAPRDVLFCFCLVSSPDASASFFFSSSAPAANASRASRISRDSSAVRYTSLMNLSTAGLPPFSYTSGPGKVSGFPSTYRRVSRGAAASVTGKTRNAHASMTRVSSETHFFKSGTVSNSGFLPTYRLRSATHLLSESGSFCSLFSLARKSSRQQSLPRSGRNASSLRLASRTFNRTHSETCSGRNARWFPESTRWVKDAENCKSEGAYNTPRLRRSIFVARKA